MNHDIQRILCEYVEKQAAKTAVEFDNKAITYFEFDKQIRVLADKLKEAGVIKGSIVAVCIPNSIEMIISIYAILYLRAIVLPINLDLPIERIQTIFSDSQPKIALCKKELESEIIQLNIKSITLDSIDLYMDIPRNTFSTNDITENDYAFCIYTSGSTGIPKGVLLNYKGILNHAAAKIKLLNLTSNTKICLSFNIGFVASIWQILVPILEGSTLILYEKNLIKKPYQLFKQIEKDHLSMISITPNTLSAYMQYMRFDKYRLQLQELKLIILTGEKINDKLVIKFYELYKHITLINAYGQTECSDDTYHYCIPRSIKPGNVPIGAPIENIYGFILNDNFNEDDFGELYIGGAGVAQGYLHDQKLTDSKFIRLPGFNYVLYKTGDLVKRVDNDMLVYVGRTDNQVKIRGYRVELEEIESNIYDYQGIIQTVVRIIDLNETDRILEAVYVGTKNIDKKALQEFLANRLPEYMIPSKLTQVSSLPCTPNGKIDRKNIDTSKLISDEMGDQKSKCKLSELDNTILSIIKTNLDEVDFPYINIDTDLIDAGIDSITFIKMVVLLEEAFDFEFDDEMLLVTSFTNLYSVIKYVESKIQERLGI